MTHKCIIFDCDGVLVDSEGISIRILLEQANSIGIDIDLDFAMKYFAGKSLKSCFVHMERIGGKAIPESFEAEYRKRSFDAFTADLKPIAGVIELMDKLTLDYCVASSGPLNKMEHNLNIVGLIDKFRGKMYSSYDIGSWKPEPEIFYHAAREMGYRPDECIVIEDSLAGIQAAKAGGFDVLGFLDNPDVNFLASENVRTFSDMAILNEIITSWR